MNDVEMRVKQILRERLDVADEQLVPSARLKEDLGADSLELAEIVMHLEEAFGIEIPDEDVANTAAVQQVIDYVQGRVELAAQKK